MGVIIRKTVTLEDLAKIRKSSYIELHLETNDGEVGDIVKCWTQKYFDEIDD